MHTLEYRINHQISVEQFIDVLRRSTLAARRPRDSAERVQRMLDNATLTVTAWDGGKLAGVARASTDFALYCYLSDLAVDESYQRSGIGKMLITLTRLVAGDESSFILLSAPLLKPISSSMSKTKPAARNSTPAPSTASRPSTSLA